MKRWLSLVFILFTLQITATEWIKEEISHCQKKLEETSSESEKSELYYKLAFAYFHDQEIDKSFQYFLLALKGIESKELLDTDDQQLYTEALDYYLNQSGMDPIRVAGELIERYGEKNHNNIELSLLMAIAYANVGKYDLFFERFYYAYPYLKDSFLAYKAQGILYLRLFHHSRVTEERHAYQEEAFRYLTLALAPISHQHSSRFGQTVFPDVEELSEGRVKLTLPRMALKADGNADGQSGRMAGEKWGLDRNPDDASLYKVLIFLAKDEKNNLLVHSYLQKMVEHQVPIARSDIYLYVREAVALEEFEVGQKIIDQASSLYDYSRAITAAQEYLNQHRG